jgi:glycosyltransferase involved in cell wall biosynthesis
MRKLNIGFLSYWGTPRGLPAVTLCYAKMLKDTHNVHILKQGLNVEEKEFKNVANTVTEYPNYIVDREFFKKWLIENKIDAVFFNEYKQWNKDENELTQLCKELNVKTYGILVFEKLKEEQCKEYDKLICETHTAEKIFRTMKVRNFTYIPYSLDLKEFPIVEKQFDKKFTFFHPAGMGGVIDRKNTDKVIKAFIEMNREDAKLIITSQKSISYELPKNLNIEIICGNLDREKLINIYQSSHVTVLPSKYETIGIPILESLACGTPVITTDVPPMNELVVPNSSGFLCRPDKMVQHPDISINIAELDSTEICHKMEICFNELIYGILMKYSRHHVEEKYDLEKNKKYMLEFLEGEFNE